MAIPFKYNVRSLLVRRVSTVMTGGGIALVVAVFVVVMAMVAGFAGAIQDSGSPDNMIVLRKGSTTETGSAFSLGQFDALKFLPQIKRDRSGQPLASPELPVQVLMSKIGGGRENIVLRGVMPVALQVHDKVHITQGRMFNPALNEVIVGKALLKRYTDCAIGSTLRLGRGTWKVVGIFEAGGSSFESEVWAGLHNVQDDTQRGAYYASVVLKMTPGRMRRRLSGAWPMIRGSICRVKPSPITIATSRWSPPNCASSGCWWRRLWRSGRFSPR